MSSQLTEQTRISNFRLFINIFPALVASQLVFISAALINTLMAARVSTTAMAAIGLTGSILWLFNSLGIGILSVVLSRMGYVYGKEKYHLVGAIHRQAYYVIALASIAIAILDILIATNLDLIGLEPELIAIGRPYLLLSCFSIPLMLFITHLRNLNSCIAYTLPTLLLSLLSLCLIIPFNLIFMYGDLPLIGHNPGYSAFTHIFTYIIYISLMLLIIKYKKSVYGKLQLFNPLFAKPNKEQIKDILKVGIPVSIQYWLENSFYGIVALSLAHLGTSVTAAHQSGANSYSAVYIFAAGASASITSIASRRLGEQRRDLTKAILHHTLALIICINVCIGIAIIVFRHQIAGAYIQNDPVALNLSQHVLICLAIANVFDGIYACLLGYLIPYRDSRYTFLTTFTVSWLIYLPLASMFAFTDWFFGIGNFGLYAYWVAFILIPMTTATSLYCRVHFKWNRMDDATLYQKLAAYEK
ncbi:hypothetical protein CJP74_04925 [Psittacicella melopsittaci]|uniref:MATE family efflux transporter n=1 Tax=Psittacicella melopsittaci TaxID=2028576 RepID=A0A3A1Y4G1_9GAMM|nr:MATE family efflux transporter [Psittacicella melopsittaci]RIY32341.1 hypothetical protein CJP74_04925 [Psittacicella melopsittaci]